MGNNPSKPKGKAASSPVASHSSSQSTNHPRKEPRAATQSPESPLAQPLAALPQPSTYSQHQNQNQNQTQTQHQHHHHHQQQDIPSYSQPIPNPSHEHGPQDQMGTDHSRLTRKSRKDPSTPVRVPRGSDPRRQKGPDSQFEPSGPPRDLHYLANSNLNVPPRLPLPIEEELHTPGSPIITPSGIPSDIREDDMEALLPNRISTVSNTTLDEEDIGNELQAYPPADSRKTVPTLIEWKQGGNKVYVTGTFASWSRKFRMTRDPDTNVLSAVLQLPPGTHHVKFIVDGDMKLSKELPTAVDFTNILVNYIEVSADDLPREPPPENKAMHGLFPPQVLPPGTDAQDHVQDSRGQRKHIEGQQDSEPVIWGDRIPRYLIDFECPEQSARYQRAARAVNEFATPPSLPLFLGKSILNGTTPMKDDSSVLNLPNHTVLNHLATSSIKNNVLATSVTTRYKRKYVTTIMYKPTLGGGD